MMNKEINNFKIPEGYFEQLEKDILSKTIYSDKKIIRINNVKRMFAAASIILTITFSTIIYQNIIKKTENKISKDDKEVIKQLYNNIYSENQLESQLAELESDEFYLK